MLVGFGIYCVAIKTNWPTLAHKHVRVRAMTSNQAWLIPVPVSLYTTHALPDLHANLIPKPSGDEALVKWEFSEFPSNQNMGQILLYARAWLLMGAEWVVFSYPCSMLYPLWVASILLLWKYESDSKIIPKLMLVFPGPRILPPREDLAMALSLPSVILNKQKIKEQNKRELKYSRGPGNNRRIPWNRRVGKQPQQLVYLTHERILPHI